MLVKNKEQAPQGAERQKVVTMTKTEAKEIAKKTLLDAIAVAYYKICDDDEYSEEDQETIIKYINQYGKSACKAFGKEYFTF